MIHQIKISALVFASLLLSVLTSPSIAGVDIGDSPALHFKIFNSKDTFNLPDYHGKIVVVDFWATWCKPCMAQAEHMVNVNQQYGPQGLQIVGISLDQDPSALSKVIADKGFTWPMSYDGNGNAAIAGAWGVDGIPHTCIIGPDGTVLWQGHPAALDGPLADAFKNHPPQLVDPKIMAAAVAALDAADKALADNETAKAAKSFLAIPDAARVDGKFAEREKTTGEKLQTAAEAELAKVDSLVEARQYTQALATLQQLSQSFSTLPVGTAIKQKMIEVQSSPAVKSALAALKKEKDSTEALAVAKKLKDNKHDEQAYARFKEITESYPGTPAAIEAGGFVKAYEADGAFIARLKNKSDSAKAQAALSLAENYRASGKIDLARKKYQDVIAQFPDTTWSKTAQREMDALND